MFKIVLLAMLALIVSLAVSLEISFALITAIAVAALAIIASVLYRFNRVEFQHRRIE